MCYKNLKELASRVKKLVLNDWCVSCTENAVRIWKVDIPFIVPTYDIQIDDSLGFTLIVHGWFLPEDHIIYKNNKRSLRNITVSDLIKEIVQLKVCVGHTKDAFTGNSVHHVLPINTDPFERTEASSPFPCKEYNRAKDCKVLVSEYESNCSACQDSFHIQEVANRRKRARENVPASHKAPVSVTSSNRIKLTLQSQRLKCKQLECEIEKMKMEVDQKSVPVTNDLGNDLLNIISENGDKMTPFMKLFWDQQKRIASRAPQGRRYHPMVIKWCISMAAKSASAYDELRETFKDSTIILPSRRVLRDYTNVIPPMTGFNPGVIQELVQITAGYNGCQKYVFILLDEMKIQANLIWDKHSGELIGYVDLGDPDTNFATLEKSDHLASHALLLMVRGIATTLKHTIGYFATADVTAVQLFPLFWRAVSILEMTCNLAVVGATADGASPNRKLFSMHEMIQGRNDKDVVYCTKNLFQPDRNIYFFSDPPHLLKTARNCLFNSGSGNCTLFHIDINPLSYNAPQCVLYFFYLSNTRQFYLPMGD